MQHWRDLSSVKTTDISATKVGIFHVQTSDAQTNRHEVFYLLNATQLKPSF